MEKLEGPFNNFNFEFFNSFSLSRGSHKNENFLWKGSFEDALLFLAYCGSFQSFKDCLKNLLFQYSKKNWSNVYLKVLTFWEEKVFPKNNKFEDFESSREDIEFGVQKILICSQLKKSVYLEMINWDYSTVLFSALTFLFEEKFGSKEELKTDSYQLKKLETEKEWHFDIEEMRVFAGALNNFFYSDLQELFYYFFKKTAYIENNFFKAKKYTEIFLRNRYTNSSFNPQKDKKSLTLLLALFADIKVVETTFPNLRTSDPIELQSLIKFIRDSNSKVH